MWLAENGYFSLNALEIANQATQNFNIQFPNAKEMINKGKEDFQLKDVKNAYLIAFITEKNLLQGQ